MAVYTSVNDAQFIDLFARFDLGEWLSAEEISDGIENSNFRVTTRCEGELRYWILTLFENLHAQQLPYFMDVLSHLAAHGLLVPAPKMMRDGQVLFQLCGKPALLIPCFAGGSVLQPNVMQCQALGETLAHLHLAGQPFEQKRPSPRDIHWMYRLRDEVAAALPEQDLQLLDRSIQHYLKHKAAMADCPKGLIHGDLFRDNVLFTGDAVSGLIDFYHACDDALLFDLAVVINDWAVDEHGRYETTCYQAVVNGYRSVRPWTSEEERLWPSFLHLAALRFWLSRLQSRYGQGYQKHSTQGDLTKDPDAFKRIIMLADCA